MTETSGGSGGDPDIGEMSFEDALAELRAIVERLEQGETKLDDAIQAYERGAKLKAHCERKLKEAESRIEQIRLGQDGTPSDTQALDVDRE
jgi:exodeoxyribonuclease VII small subunit